MTQNVVLEVAQPHHAPLLANLLELYLHDLSDVFPIEIGPSGRFGYDKLPRYWQEPTRCFPFLIRADERVAGFVLVTRGSPVTDDPDDLDVAEFFVLRRHRRDHVGRRAAFQLWDRLPGHWIVRVSLGNHRALPSRRVECPNDAPGHRPCDMPDSARASQAAGSRTTTGISRSVRDW